MGVSFYVWLVFRVLFISLIIVFLLNGLDDLFVDILYYVRRIYRAIFRRRAVKPVTLDQLNAVPEKPAAIMIPAWDESNVIRRMLLNTIHTLQYKNYHFFIGTYPNDEATKLEVEKVREIFPNIEVVVTPADGPTNKADCLNWVYQGILLYEKQHNMRFAFCVLHDSEDVVHPTLLKDFNYLIPRIHFVQLPVFPLDVGWRNLVVGVYMDEFAENHTKDLRSREILTSALPCAGVGAAVSHEALDYLARTHKNQVFDIGSLTEDYLMGLRLKDFEGKKIFLQQDVDRIELKPRLAGEDPKEKRVREPIATREFFPTTFRTSVRQKSRWILGIALQGWGIGWSKSPAMNYFLFRDRKSVAANLLVVVGYLVVGFWLVAAGIQGWNPKIAIPPLVETHEIYYKLLLGVLALFAWRIINRISASWHIYGFRQGLMAIPRLFFGNFLNFFATCLAIKRYVASRISGKVPEWGKTAHAFPTEEQLRTYHRRLGDLLLERRLITTGQLEDAIAKQKTTGKKLGEILLENGAVWEEDLVSVLARQRDRKAVELDPYSTSKELLDLVPRSVAERYRVFPVGMEGDTLVLATDVMEGDDRGKELAALLSRPVSLRWTSVPDIRFAIARGYSRETRSPTLFSDRLGQRLVQEGKVTAEDLQKALRKQKRTNQKLGEVLVEMKLISPEALDKELGNI